MPSLGVYLVFDDAVLGREVAACFPIRARVINSAAYCAALAEGDWRITMVDEGARTPEVVQAIAIARPQGAPLPVTLLRPEATAREELRTHSAEVLRWVDLGRRGWPTMRREIVRRVFVRQLLRVRGEAFTRRGWWWQ